MAKARIEILGDSSSYQRSVKAAATATDKLSLDMKKLAVTAKSSAQAQIQASVRKDARLRQEILAYRQVASASQRGSREQIAAANLAARAERHLSGSVATSAREQRSLARSAAGAERSLGRATRGALAGSGIFRGLGRSIAFASGGFLAFASVGQFLRTSIDAAKEAQVTQKQLGAQFRASGKDVKDYQVAIDKTANRLALLAGIENDEIKAGFTTIFRTTGNVSKALRDTGTAADLARAKHLAFAQASLIVAKTEAGNTTLLRRQGFQIAKNATAEQALATLRKVVAGQAKAGTTAQERFGAVLHNTEEIIGGGLLPILNRYLTRGAAWLTQLNESGKLQKDVARVTRDVGEAFHVAHQLLSPLVGGFRVLSRVSGGAEHAVKLLGGAFLILEARAKLLRWGLISGGITRVGTAAEGSAIKIGLLSRAVNTLGKSWFFAGAALEAYAFSKTITTPQPVKVAPSPSTGPLHKSDIVKSGGQFFIQTPGGRLTRFTGPAPITGTTPTPRRGIDSPRRFQPHIAAKASPAATRTAAVSLQGRFNLAELHLAQAQLTKTTADDVKQLRVEAAIVRLQLAQTKTLKDRTAKTQQLGGILSQIASLTETTQKKAAKAVKGHTSEWVKLGGAIQAIPHDMRAVAKALGGTETSFKTIDTDKFLRDLGVNLTPAQFKAARARLSQLGAGGTVPGKGTSAFGYVIKPVDTVIHTHVKLNGRDVAVSTTRHQQKTRRRNPPQKRGPHTSGGL